MMAAALQQYPGGQKVDPTLFQSLPFTAKFKGKFSLFLLGIFLAEYEIQKQLVELGLAYKIICTPAHHRASKATLCEKGSACDEYWGGKKTAA